MPGIKLIYVSKRVPRKTGQMNKRNPTTINDLFTKTTTITKCATFTGPTVLPLLSECPIGTYADVVRRVCLRCPANSHTDGEYTSVESCICDAGFQRGGQGQEHCIGKFPMITSSNGNLFRLTITLCGEFTGHR